MKARGILVVTIVMLTFGALGVWFGPAANADCIGPTVTVAPGQAPQGTTITITGAFFTDCNDVYSCPNNAPCEPPPSEPYRGIKIMFVQGHRGWTLGTIDADSEYAFGLAAKVPEDAGVGPAKIVACRPGCLWSAPFSVGGLAAAEQFRPGPPAPGQTSWMPVPALAGLVAVLVLLAVVVRWWKTA